MSNVPTNLIPSTITQLPEYGGSSTLGYFPYSLNGRTYKVQFSNLAAVGAVPSSRVIAAGTGLTGGGDLSENRVISIANGGVGFDQLSATGVSAGSYGSGGDVPVITVDAKGRVTDISTTPLVVTGYVPDSRTITTGAGLLGGGSLASNRTLSVDFYASAPQALGSASPGVSNAAARGDHVHPAVNLSDTTQTQGALPLGRGGTGDALSPVAGAVVYSTGTKFALADPGDPGQVLTSSGSGEPYWSTIAGTGTVTSVSVLTANGFSGTVAFANTTPQITISTTVTGMVKGDGVSLSEATPGVDYVAPSAYISSGLTMATDRLLGRTDLGTGAAQEITVGTGLSLSAGSLVNSAPDQIVSLTGAGTTTVTGTYPNFTITSNDAYTGTVTSVAASGGSTGLTFSGSPITTSGTLTLGGTLAVASGGTGATTASGARTNLGAAASGANSDITSLSGITGGIATPDYIDFDTTATVTRATGRLWWDNADGNQTLSLGMAGSNATLQIGEEMYFRIKASSAITEGQVVMFTGTVGNSGALTGAPATGLTKDTASYVMGVATEDIALNGWGYVTQFGLVRSINTTGGAEAWVDGQILYYDPAVAGGLTKNVPSAPAAKVEVAAVVKAASNGSLFVRPIARFSLGQLNDVETAAAANGDLLQYNSSGGGYWQHVVPSTISVGTATNLAGGAANRIAYQTGAGATSFISAPVTPNTFLEWSGSGFQWSVNPLGTVTSVGMSVPTGLTVTGSPITTSGTLAVGLQTGYSIPTNASQANWDAAYSDRLKWDGGSSGLVAATGRTSLGLGTAAVLNAGVANGVATLDSAGTVPTSQLPAAVLGALNYQGAWNASTNTPTLTSSVGTKGYFYVVDVAGSTNLNGITDWKVGDWAVFSGSVWQKIDNTESVVSVNGYTGVVNLTYTDVGAPSTSGTGATGTWSINVTGNAGTVTNGVYTTGSYTDPTWLVSLAASKLTGTVAVANGGTGSSTAAGARTNLGGTTVGSNFFTLTNPSAITFPRINADNTVSALDAATFRSAIGAGTGSGSVTSVDVSGGTTGLTFSGGPVTSSGTITMAGTLGVANGGTGATSLSSGYLVKGNGTSAVSASVVYDDGTNVGIGTASPAGRLDVTATSAGGTTYSYFQNNGASGVSSVGLAFAQSSAIKSSIVAAVYGNDYMTFNVGSNTERMRIDASGNVTLGIGGGAKTVLYTDQSIASVNTAGSAYTDLKFDGLNLLFRTGSGSVSERMRISSAGDVSIGTTSGGAGLFVVPRANVPYTIFNTASAGYGYSSYQYNGSAYGYLGQASSMIGGASNTDFAIRSENNMLFAIGGTERARIDSSGRLLVGVSSASPNTPAGSIQYVAGAQLTSGNFGRIWVPGQSIGSATYAGLYGMASTYNAYYSGGWKSIGGGTASAITIDEGIFSFSNSNSVGSADAALTWTTRLAVDTSGNVGVGTGSPTTKLKVYGNTGNNPTIINVQHDVSGNNFDYASVSATSSTGSVGITSWGTGSVRASTGWVQTVGAIPLVVGVNDTEVARFATSGNVGIGTSTTTYKLNVAGDLYLAGGGDLRLSSASGGNDTSLYNDAQDLFFVVNGSTRMYVNSSGNVGIGTSSPSQKLTLQGAQLIIPAAGWSSGQTAYLYLGDTNNGISSTNGSYTTYLSFNGHNWLINGTEAMRIDGSRNIGIGTTSPSTRFNVKGGTTWLQNFNGSASSPTETVDWPVPALNVTSFGDFTLQSMMAFTLPNDGNYFTGDTVWNIRLEQTASSTTSSSSTGFRLFGPGYLAFGSGQQERLRFSTSGGITSSDLADAVGYKGLPQNQQTSGYTLALSDMGKHIYATAANFNITIPANATVAFPIGTAITIVVEDQFHTLVPASGVTLVLAGTGAATTGTRTLAQGSVATIIKVGTNRWYVSGSGVT